MRRKVQVERERVSRVTPNVEEVLDPGLRLEAAREADAALCIQVARASDAQWRAERNTRYVAALDRIRRFNRSLKHWLGRISLAVVLLIFMTPALWPPGPMPPDAGNLMPENAFQVTVLEALALAMVLLGLPALSLRTLSWIVEQVLRRRAKLEDVHLGG